MRKRFSFLLIALCALSCSSPKTLPQRMTLELPTRWLFQTTEDASLLTMAEPDFDDSLWPDINVLDCWEHQGYDFDGYGWYRLHFVLPQAFNNPAFAGLLFSVGLADENDQTYLNGKLIGATTGWFDQRVYKIFLEDTLLRWGQENVLAIRVSDGGGRGGLFGGNFRVETSYQSDHVTIDCMKNSYIRTSDKEYSKEIQVATRSLKPISGELVVRVTDVENNKQVMELRKEARISTVAPFSYSFHVPVDPTLPYDVDYEFVCQDGSRSIASDVIPYLMTPASDDTPRINSARRFGVRPNSPIIYKMAVSGKKPVTYLAQGLPKGVMLDSKSGVMTGKVGQKGTYPVTLIAENEAGKDTVAFELVVGDRLALTPPMGWNHWYVWNLNGTQAKIMEAGVQMMETGLIDYGWSYINVDDAWEGERDSQGYITGNDRYPDIAAMASFFHSNGLKLGLYSSPGPLTCGTYLGSYQYEAKDAEQYARWGVDYLKYDWCSYGRLFDGTREDRIEPFAHMARELRKQDRDIVYSLCQYGQENVWEWGDSIGAQLWRTRSDMTDTWEVMSEIGFSQIECAPYSAPGNWNDPDMLMFGKHSAQGTLENTRLNAHEQYTQMTLWTILASPLLITCDLTQLDEFTANLLTNPEVIAVNQDVLGIQGRRVMDTLERKAYTKPLSDGSVAVAVFNVSDERVQTTFLFKDLGMEDNKYNVRNLWRGLDCGLLEEGIPVVLPAHGAALFKLGIVN